MQKETLIKYDDLIRPTRCVIEESQLYLRLEHEDKESYVSYFTVNTIVGELDFPSSEIFYFQQQQFTFPVDTSMNVEIVENRKALTTVRNKKKGKQIGNGGAQDSDVKRFHDVFIRSGLQPVNDVFVRCV